MWGKIKRWFHRPELPTLTEEEAQDNVRPRLHEVLEVYPRARPT